MVEKNVPSWIKESLNFQSIIRAGFPKKGEKIDFSVEATARNLCQMFCFSREEINSYWSDIQVELPKQQKVSC